MKTSILTLGAISLLVAGMAQPAFASEQSISVAFKSYELAHPDGREAVRQRIERAAERVCSHHGQLGLAARLASNECFEETYAQAIAQLESVVAENLGSDTFQAAAYSIDAETRNG